MELDVDSETLPTVLTSPTATDPLSTLTFTLVFPHLRHSYDDPIPCRESTADLEALNGELTAQIAALLITVSSLPESVVDPAGVKLHIGIARHRYCTLDPHCYHRLFSSHRLRLVPHPLPSLPRVRSLVLGPGKGYFHPSFDDDAGVHPLHPSVLWKLISCMPALQEVKFPDLWERFPIAYEYKVFNHFSRWWEGPWRDARWAFGESLEENELPKSLKSMRLYFWLRDTLMSDEDHTRPLPDLVSPKNHDPLSSALRRLSLELESLDTRAIISPDLFSPLPPSWPNLRRLKVEFHPSTPDGKWYFAASSPSESDTSPSYSITESHYPPLGPEASKDDEQWDEDWNWNGGRVENRCPDVFRTEPARDTLEPLLAAFARALGRMPVIEDAELFAYLNWDSKEGRNGTTIGDQTFQLDRAIHKWSVRYRIGEDGQKRLEWQVGEWRPSQQVLDAFGAVGDCEVEWKEFEFLDRLSN